MQLSVSMLAFAFLTAGFLWPTEEAVAGEGLHLVVLWMLLGLFLAAQRWRFPGDAKEACRSIRWLDLGVFLVIVGHLISTIVVFRLEGDRRAALNLTFEWMGLGVAWWILRSLFVDRRVAAQGVAVIVAICVGLSCFGIWQHHVFYAEQSAWYRELRSELDQAIASTDASQFSRRAEISRLFQEQQIPMQGSARVAWENRLLSGSEPFATFSLANTLAGILAVGLVLLLGQASLTSGEKKRISWLGMALLTLQVSLIGYCLILTKSRSAWLGACVGFGILVVLRNRVSAVQHGFRWLLAGSLLLAGIIGSAAVVGGLDKEVILESPRSLQFRLLYWTGTLKMLREHPLAGAGPGNFRQVYLQYKADETSEEIRDPHNAFLDAWSSSGFIGLAGLVLIVGWMCWWLMKQPRDPKIPVEAKSRNSQQLWSACGGLILGFLLQAMWTWLNGSDEWIDTPAKMLLLAGIPLLLMQGSLSLRQIDGAACLAAASAMIVNLLAAGGFEMPAVMITLMFCLAAGASQSTQANGRIAVQRPMGGRVGSLIFASMCLGGFVGVVRFGLLPVTVSRHYQELGNMLLRDIQYPSRALDNFQRAIAADPKNVTPRQRIAEVASYRLSELVALHTAENTENLSRRELNTEEHGLVDQGLLASDDLICCDRRNVFAYRLRSDVRWNASQLTDDSELRELALQDLQAAAMRYPSSVDVWLHLAERLDAMGDSHRKSAQVAVDRVLQLDEINHKWGHADRFLTDTQLATVRRIRGDEPEF
ncbi:MAG TPA: O-antigen ligase family protein [Planctomycetaceae bacterium]|nr:O-antigen ligase family protein [Planctomycetaceae bacterium]